MCASERLAVDGCVGSRFNLCRLCGMLRRANAHLINYRYAGGDDNGATSAAAAVGPTRTGV